MDGVLVDSAAAHRLAWQRLGEEVGTPFTAELFERTFGQRNATVIPKWLGGEVEPQRLARLADRKEEIYRQLVSDGAVRVYARIPQLIDELRQHGAAVAIASSGPRANIDLLIDVMGGGGK